MVAGGTSPAGTVLLTVNPKQALGTGCNVRDRKAGNHSPRAFTLEVEGKGKAGTRSFEESLDPPEDPSSAYQHLQPQAWV